MMYKQTLAALCLSSFIAGSAIAAVSPEEAARLGNDLTPLGAEAAGNAVEEWLRKFEDVRVGDRNQPEPENRLFP